MELSKDFLRYEKWMMSEITVANSNLFCFLKGS